MSPPGSITTKVIKQRLKEKFGKDIRLLGEFEGWKIKSTFKCMKCKHIWNAKTLNVLHSKWACPVCAQNKRAEHNSIAHKNSQILMDRFEQNLLDIEEKFNIVCLDDEIVSDRLHEYRFKCNDCGHQRKATIKKVLKSKYGCTNCAETVRLDKTSKNARLRGKKMLLTTEKYAQLVHRRSHGRTKLISEWRGVGKTRRMQCIKCDRCWTVKAGRYIDSDILCPVCPNGLSRYSHIAIKWLELEAKKRKIKIRHAKNKGEYRIPGTRYRVDGFHAKTKTVFEFYGDIYHGNPKTCKPRSRPNPFNNKTATQLYKATIKRENDIRSLGYNIVVMWQSDFSPRG